MIVLRTDCLVHTAHSELLEVAYKLWVHDSDQEHIKLELDSVDELTCIKKNAIEIRGLIKPGCCYTTPAALQWFMQRYKEYEVGLDVDEKGVLKPDAKTLYDAMGVLKMGDGWHSLSFEYVPSISARFNL